MTLTYHWDNVTVSVPDSCGSMDTYEPRMVTETRDIEYMFDVDITIDDIVGYLIPKKYGQRTAKEIEELKVAKDYILKTIDFFNDIGAIDYDELENDEYFVEYMAEKYEDEAWEQFQDGQ